METKCSDPGCDTPVKARGLCSLHYQRYRYHGQLDTVAPPKQRICAHCGNSFDPKLRRWGAMYCSSKCNDAARYARKRAAKGRRAEQCEQCGEPLIDRRLQARFCSTRCGQNWRNIQVRTQAQNRKLAARKPCRGCGSPIPVERNGRALYCTEACKIRSRRHEAYGLTKPELEALLAQHEQCAICRTEDWGRKGPQVDHDHDSGKVRGILCLNCNNGLGRFGDDPARLRAAADYLERTRACVS